MKVFNLPDLGEGLPDAEIVEWLVSEGDEVTVDQPLVSMETAKAVVEVPSPFTGKVAKFHGGAGDVIKTGAPLAEFQVEGDAGAEETTQTEPPATESTADSETSETASASDGGEREDSGTVVGKMQAGGEVLRERTSSVGGVKVTPAVRALARKLKVDLSAVEATGAEGVVTASDVRKAAEDGSAPARARTSEASSSPSQDRPEPEMRREPEPKPAPEPTRQQPSAQPPSGDWEPVRGTRRTMARVMSEAHKSVVPTTLMDDADIHAWRPGEDITVRLLRALWAGARAEPGLNAWFDGEQEMRMVHKNMHVGMAVDTPDGLFVAALRDVNKADKAGLRQEINRLRENVQSRSIPPEDLKDYTVILSNFGKFAGRYATPVITPPCVAIVAAGTLRHEVVPVLGGVEAHRMIPLSLTFDHRACTGGEAARFLKAMLEDLAKTE
jgi:2-oxoisovalerate dehydrogenase E2 component (dihydrolipoyl transacylase)